LTIDERIERLTERHEALAQTVESITVDIRDLKDIAAKSLDSVNALLRIAESHERRITNIEGGEA
jgi:archaellum component FlaC